MILSIAGCVVRAGICSICIDLSLQYERLLDFHTVSAVVELLKLMHSEFISFPYAKIICSLLSEIIFLGFGDFSLAT